MVLGRGERKATGGRPVVGEREKEKGRETRKRKEGKRK